MLGLGKQRGGHVHQSREGVPRELFQDQVVRWIDQDWGRIRQGWDRSTEQRFHGSIECIVYEELHSEASLFPLVVVVLVNAIADVIGLGSEWLEGGVEGTSVSPNAFEESSVTLYLLVQLIGVCADGLSFRFEHHVNKSLTMRVKHLKHANSALVISHSLHHIGAMGIGDCSDQRETFIEGLVVGRRPLSRIEVIAELGSKQGKALALISTSILKGSERAGLQGVGHKTPEVSKLLHIRELCHFQGHLSHNWVGGHDVLRLAAREEGVGDSDLVLGHLVLLSGDMGQVGLGCARGS